jgi:hypothetical protein
MNISAMKQALGALKNSHPYSNMDKDLNKHSEAITALRQAIEQAEKQEPVAWMYEWGGNKHLTFVDQRFIEKAHPHFNKSTPLYTAPVHASDISQERVDETAKGKHEFECPRCGHCCQQRKWVGLTDEEIDGMDCVELKYIGTGEYVVNGKSIWNFARAIEAKLKEKNA